MNQEASLSINNVYKFALLLFLVSSIAGIVRSEVLIEPLAKDMKSILRISGYVSVLITSISSVLILLIIFLANWYLNVISDFGLTKNTYAIAVSDVLKVFTLNELFKFFLIFIFLTSEVQYLLLDNDFSKFETQLTNLDFTRYSQYSDTAFIVIGSVIYAIAIRDRGVAIKETLFSASSFLLLIMFLTYII